VPTPADLRSGLTGLATLANSDLAALWGTLQTAVQAREALLEVLPALIDKYGSGAATYAADWYDELRDELNVSGRFTSAPAEIVDVGAEALAGWAVGPLFKPEPDWATALTLVQGGTQRRIVNAARETITGSSVLDPHADGWQRVGSGECEFCALLIGRGSVYSERTADFASHDHCHCAAVPAFKGRARAVKPYMPTNRNISDADRARVRSYIRTH
jgi:hypothetical protein